VHGAKASRNGVSATIPIESGQQRNIPQKTNHHHTDFPEQTAQTAQSALTLRLFGMCSCNDTAVLMDQKNIPQLVVAAPLACQAFHRH